MKREDDIVILGLPTDMEEEKKEKIKNYFKETLPIFLVRKYFEEGKSVEAIAKLLNMEQDEVADILISLNCED